MAPFVTKVMKTKTAPLWRNDKIKKLKRICQGAQRKWRKTKLTVHYEILQEQLKLYNNSVKQARISHLSKLISDHKNNPKFLFSIIDLLTNSDFKKLYQTSTNDLCEDFADHFTCKIDDIRSNLLTQQSTILNTPDL